MYYYEKQNKYGNVKTERNGIIFDSKKESTVFSDFEWKERLGVISNLQRQVKYELIPAQYKIIDGKKKCIEKSCAYVADIVYKDNETNETFVIDVKSPATRTDSYIIKRKLMLQKYGIQIKEL
jgi:hypothetical protein